MATFSKLFTGNKGNKSAGLNLSDQLLKTTTTYSMIYPSVALELIQLKRKKKKSGKTFSKSLKETASCR